MTVCFVVAMKEELRFLKKPFRGVTAERRGSCTLFRPQGGRFILLESGMGAANAAAAASLLVEEFSPALLVSAGFAGALSPALRPGELVIGSRFLSLHQGVAEEVQGVSLFPFPAKGKRGTVLSVGAPERKVELARLVEGETAVVDMETAAVARVAAEAEIPLLSLRAVTDPLQEELAFSVEEISDGGGNVVPLRALSLMLRRPSLLPQMLRLARNASRAGTSLASAASLLLRRDELLPPPLV